MPLYYRDKLMVTCVHGHISYMGESVTRFFDVSVQVATPNEGHISSHVHECNVVHTAASHAPPFPHPTHRGRKGRGTTTWTARLIYWNIRRKGSSSSPTCSHFRGFLGVRNVYGMCTGCADVSCSGSVMAMFKDKSFTCIWSSSYAPTLAPDPHL